jgi:6-pyruvoyltetrahydropterin/6-carboxytetrahydropterin synthase
MNGGLNMGKWVIDKQFSFCYGHRVWSQKLVAEYCETGDTACKCRHLHGHEGLVHVFLEGDTLGLVEELP